jgi:hypothetical protein
MRVNGTDLIVADQSRSAQGRDQFINAIFYTDVVCTPSRLLASGE